MKVLFLLITAPEASQHGNLYSDLMLEFVRRGHEVFAATVLQESEGRPSYVDDFQGVRVLHVRCGELFGVGGLRKVVTMLTLPRRYMRAIRGFFGGQQFDLLVYPTPPITFAPVVRQLKREQGCRTYLILRDIFPQNARDLGLIKDPFTFAFFRRKERQLYETSDFIGCMSQGNIDYLLRQNNIDRTKAEVLPNWEMVGPNPPGVDTAIRREFGLEGKFVAVFGGNIGPAQEIEFLLDLAALYRQRQDIFFLLVGGGSAKTRIRERINAMGLDNVRMLDYLPRDQFNALLRACDVGLINLDRRFTIPNIPSKVTAYWAASLPVLAAIDEHTDFGRMLDECGGGLWSVTGDLPAYQRNFERLLHDSGLRRRLGTSGRLALLEKFTVERAFDTIIRHWSPGTAHPESQESCLPLTRGVV